MFCTNCGKEIPEGSAFCPECGTQQHVSTSYTTNYGSYSSQTGQPMVQNTPYNTMCIIGLVVSCISLLLNFWGIVGIAGTIVSVIGLLSCKKKNEKGNVLAIIGIIIGAFSIIYGVFSLLCLSILL